MAMAAPADDGDGGPSCSVCWSAPVATVLTACGHAVLCADCLARIVAGPPPQGQGGAAATSKCPVCSTPIPPGAWNDATQAQGGLCVEAQGGLCVSSADAARSYHPESVEPLRVAEAAALGAGRSAFPAGVLGFIAYVQRRGYRRGRGRENMLLRLAAQTDGAVEATAMLLDRGACLGACDSERGQTALHIAALHNAADTVLLLLRRGASAYAVDAQGRTPLHGAADASAVAALQWLVAAGAPLEARDAAGATPLLLAAASASDECLSLLLQSGADIGATGARGWTALHHAAHADGESCVQTLVWHGAVKRARARDGRRPTEVCTSLSLRLALHKMGPGPRRVLAWRPHTLRARFVVLGLCALVAGFLRDLTVATAQRQRRSFSAKKLNRELLVFFMFAQPTTLRGPPIQPFAISMSEPDRVGEPGADDDDAAAPAAAERSAALRTRPRRFRHILRQVQRRIRAWKR